MNNLIRLAKRFANKPTEFNKVQFLDAFNELEDDNQMEAVKKGSELSSVLIGWCAEVRIEMGASSK
ncbi:hypothetical protein [Vibrio sp. D431a]|uniref:hypothetical protein n=1 Tax=Vibrio sp. D431a TaxID=2837388 RepID=UPI00255484A2|nr:hypothetical protein [Vibrio sp. D431a]MDK9793318.1 hypothetical protein [Vibrio sp. D431a]